MIFYLKYSYPTVPWRCHAPDSLQPLENIFKQFKQNLCIGSSPDDDDVDGVQTLRCFWLLLLPLWGLTVAGVEPPQPAAPLTGHSGGVGEVKV